QRPAGASSLQRRAVLAADVRARARRSLRPDRGQGHGDRNARAPHLQRGARHLLEVILDRAGRDEFLALMRETYGSSMSREEFDWWFAPEPHIVTAARENGDALGVLAMSPVRMSNGLAVFAVHAVTSAAARGRGVFSKIELANEEEAARAGAHWALGFTNPLAGPILVDKLGWEDVTSLRIWVRPKRLRRRREGQLRVPASCPPFEQRHAVSFRAHHIVRDP